jgi:hypothetical protein
LEEEMSPDPKDLLRIVNSYGFAFQLRIENEVMTTQDKHHWRVSLREHPWIDPKSQQEEFIDLVLTHTTARMVVECKRVLDADWVFLVPDQQSDQTYNARLLSAFLRPGQSPSKWEERSIPYASYQSSICMIRGHGEKDKPLLERLSAPLLRSLDYLADEELRLLANPLANPHNYPEWFYIPAIVTTAKLHVCRCDPSKVNIQNGQMRLDDMKFEPVRVIRFEKTLSAKPPSLNAKTLQDADIENERTIFIIQSSGLSDFLTAYHNA